MSGSQIGSALGFVVGSFFGPVGGQIGALIGGYIGGVIDPTIIKGPSIGDAQQQTSQGGMPIPKVYGHAPPIAPTLIDGDKIARKITRTQDVGKGATQKTKTEAFIATRFFLVCESNGDAKIARIYRNGKLVYSAIAGDNIDATTAAFASQLTIYDGGPTQGPDPSLEAIHGVGNTPYYRGRLCFIVRDDDETQTGGAANQYRVEVISSGTSSTTCNDEGLIAWWPLDDAAGGGVAREVVAGRDGVYSADCTLGPPLNAGGGAGSLYMETIYDYMIVDGYAQATFNTTPSTGWTVSAWCRPKELIAGSVHKNVATYWASDQFGTANWCLKLDGTGNMQPSFVQTHDNFGGATSLSNATPYGTNQTIFMVATFEPDGSGTGTGTHRLYLNGSLVDTHVGDQGSGLHGNDVIVGGGPNYPTSYGFIGWVQDVKLYNYPLSAEEVLTNYYDPADYFPLPDIAGAFVDRYGNVTGICAPRVSADSVQWKDIVSDIAGRASSILPAKLDIAHMTDEVPGFVLGRADLTAADYIRSLCLWGASRVTDMPEYDGMLHAVRRGGAIAGTLDEDDLLAIEDEDDDTRGQAIDGYQRVTVLYPDPANNYVTTPQTAPRSSPDVSANSNVSIECPIPFGADTMAQKADIMQKIAFLQVEGKFKRAFPAEYSKYVPSDAVMFRDRRYLLTKASYDEAMVQLEGTYDRPSAYTSVAKGTAAPAPEPPAGNLKGPTVFAVVQCNPLRDADSGTPGIYVGARSPLDNSSGWPGCEVQISIDGGVTYQTAVTITAPATMGRLVNDTGTGSSREPITVDVWGADVLESVTTAQIAAGANLSAVITAGVADIFQFQNATEDSSGNYELSTLTNDLKGTTEAAHSAGETFILLDDAVVFIPIDASLAGQTIYVRAITLGTAVANNDNTIAVVVDETTYIIDGGEVTP